MYVARVTLNESATPDGAQTLLKPKNGNRCQTLATNVESLPEAGIIIPRKPR